MLTLELTRPDQAEPTNVEVKGDKVTIGRAPHCDVVLEGREYGASGEHARIEKLGGIYYLFDQGSTNGTALNGTRIRPHTSAPLAHNDKVYIGRWLIRCRVVRETARYTVGASGNKDGRADQILGRLRVAEAAGPDEVRKTLEKALEAVEPHERGRLLHKLVGQADEGVVRDAVAEVLEKREAVREACYEAMISLSAHHCGQETFESPEEVLRFFRLSDQALEMMLEWIVGCISSRRAFEERFSAKVTRFFGMDANPIKHALTPAQVGRYLLNWEDERDAEEIKKNLQEALRDLTAHQLALLAGVQQALKTALQQLDPAGAEKRAAKDTWLGGPFARSKAWDEFKETYRELLDNESKLFNEVIYPSLRQGYLEAHESQLAEMRSGESESGQTHDTEVLEDEGAAQQT